MRTSVDLCHRDGFIKNTVMAHPERYILHDPKIVPMLKQLKAAGKKVFLLTNSMYEYTDAVMNYVIHGEASLQHEGTTRRGDWKDLFDLVVVGACKPAFLRNDYLSIFKVDE